MNSAGKNFVVSGVSRGLGEAMFAQLTTAGVNPVGIGRHFTSAQRQHEEAGRCRLLACDLSDAGAVHALPLDLHGDIIFISNAGAIAPMGVIGLREDNAVVASAAVNFIAPMLLADRLAAIAQAQAVHLTVLNISSGAARHGISGWSAYCAAKAGVSMFFACMAAENPNWDIRGIDPGAMDTGMQNEIRSGDFPAVNDFKELKSKGRLRDPAAVAADILAAWLP